MNNLTAELANKELITQVLHEVLTEQPTLLAPLATQNCQTCQCHWIDPNKFRMLLWKDIKDGKETYILKIAEQKFISEDRLDRRGEVYWRLRSLHEGQEKPSAETKPSSPAESPLKRPAPKPLSEQSEEDRKKWAKYVSQVSALKEENKALTNEPPAPEKPLLNNPSPALFTSDRLAKFQERQARS